LENETVKHLINLMVQMMRFDFEMLTVGVD